MAIVKKEDTTRGLNMRMQLPPTRVAAQCIEEVFKKSGKDNMMIERTWQVLEHPPVSINDQSIDLAGVELKEYLVTKHSDGNGGFLEATSDKTKKALGSVYSNFDILKLEMPADGLDTDNPPLLAKGIVADMQIYGKEDKLRMQPTPEQIKNRQQGDIQKDDEGKDITIFRPNIGYILGRSKVEPKPF